MLKEQHMQLLLASPISFQCYAADVPVSSECLGISVEDHVCKLWKTVDNWICQRKSRKGETLAAFNVKLQTPAIRYWNKRLD